MQVTLLNFQHTLIHPFGLDILKDGQLYHFYWTEYTDGQIKRARTMNLTSTADINSVLKLRNDSFPIMDLKVFFPDKQQGQNQCSKQNFGCQHLCLATPSGGVRCACADNYKLNADNKTCQCKLYLIQKILLMFICSGFCSIS
jgi:hypothetical protein